MSDANAPRPAYLLVQGTVTDPEGFKAYNAALPPIYAKFGGRHVSLTPGARVEGLEGAVEDRRIVVSTLPSKEAGLPFCHSPRVVAVKEWLTRNYSLNENPGLGKDGLFYYYHTMAKALTIAGIDTLVMKDGSKVNWRQEVAKRLLNLQNADGSWVNKESARYMESDPHLVNAYATLTMEIHYRGL